jgi:hypothetical protein
MATNRDKDTDIDRQPGDVLGITRDVTPDSTIAPDTGDDESRRRRADDVREDRTADRDPIGGPDSPPGVHVAD